MKIRKWLCCFMGGMMLSASALAFDFSQLKRTDICGVVGPYYGFSSMENWMESEESLQKSVKAAVEKKNILYGSPFDFLSRNCYVFMRYEVAALDLGSEGAVYHLKISLKPWDTPEEITIRGMIDSKTYNFDYYMNVVNIYSTYTMGFIPNKRDLADKIIEVAIEQFEDLLFEWRKAQNENGGFGE